LQCCGNMCFRLLCVSSAVQSVSYGACMGIRDVSAISYKGLDNVVSLDVGKSDVYST
jgi:hypothetical protein